MSHQCGGNRRASVRLLLIAALCATGLVLASAAANSSAQAGPQTTADCAIGSAPIVCTLPADATSVDVADVASSLSGVDETTPIWAQAWAGTGGQGAGDQVRMPGGLGGFAQTLFQVSDLQGEYGSTTLYYYLGQAGPAESASSDEVAAGGGGASTVLAAADLSQTAPSAKNVLLLAGGGGGGGAEQEDPYSRGDSGGAGGVAIGNGSGAAQAPGSAGEDTSGDPSSHSGQGGACPGGGAKGKGPDGNGDWGDSGFGGTGGAGGHNGGHGDRAAWQNVSSAPASLANAGGGGNGHSGEEFPNSIGGGGGGGGGYGGGGGGGVGVGDFDPGAGGGGCSLAAEALVADSLAPNGYQPNPDTANNRQGTIQLVFDNTGPERATFEVPTPAAPGDSGTISAKYKVATESGTKTFYPSGGTLTGLWDQQTTTLTQGNGNLTVENKGGNPLSEALAISNATITPVSASSSCAGADYELVADVAVTGVPAIGLVTGTATLCGTGGITGQVSYSGSLSHINTSDISSVEIEDLLLDMTPDMVAGSRSRQRLSKPMHVRVGCRDQACKFRLRGSVKVGRNGKAPTTAPLRKKHVELQRGERRRVRVKLAHQEHADARLTRRMRASSQSRHHARLRVRVKAKGERGGVGRQRTRSKLRP